jgi:hypothetical protein
LIMKASQNEQEEENGKVDILANEIKSWKDFEYALSEVNLQGKQC